MCGTGIILSEVLHQQSNSSNNLIGGDIDQRAVTLARKGFRDTTYTFRIGMQGNYQ